MTKIEKFNFLNLAAHCSSSNVLGPGKRFIIWVQGCCFDCYNCGSPEWREIKDATLITPEDLSKKILKTQGIEGITISGGEPMLQVEGLLRLVELLHKESPLSVICYTGFTLEELRRKKDKKIDDFLSKIDVLIDGRYIDSLNDNKGLRGSTNQKIHFLSGLYRELEDEFLNRKRDMEIHLFKDHYLLVGIKPKLFEKNMGKILRI